MKRLTSAASVCLPVSSDKAVCSRFGFLPPSRRQWWVSVPPGQGQSTGSPWDPPPDAGWAPPAPARRKHVVLWVVLGVGVVVFLLPALLVVAGVVSAQHREHQPPQSLFDDSSALGAALEHLSLGVDANGAGSLTAQPPYKPTDRLPVRVSPGSVRVGDPAVSPPTVVRLGPGNSATATGTVGQFCVRVSHSGAQPMFYDSKWHAVQYGRGRSGACS
jgi:hypothetical protein